MLSKGLLLWTSYSVLICYMVEMCLEMSQTSSDPYIPWTFGPTVYIYLWCFFPPFHLCTRIYLLTGHSIWCHGLLSRTVSATIHLIILKWHKKQPLFLLQHVHNVKLEAWPNGPVGSNGKALFMFVSFSAVVKPCFSSPSFLYGHILLVLIWVHILFLQHALERVLVFDPPPSLLSCLPIKCIFGLCFVFLKPFH